LSINVELPRQEELDALAPDKELVQIQRVMHVVRDGITEAQERGAPAFAPAGQATQMIVGATDATDAAMLEATAGLYAAERIKRVYFSAYSPIPDADPQLPPIAPPLLREHRLYQADWLVRYYGYAARELTTAESPNLELDIDPKLSYALRHRERFPVDVNRADRRELLRIPGLGVRSVKRILGIRRWHRIRVDDLVRLRVPLGRALPFVVLADHTPGVEFDRLDLRARVARRDQLDLFAASRSARSGEL
jgi:predicted DNA-binding helix-hairpin-helix protein